MELLIFKLSIGRFGVPLQQIDELLPAMSIQLIPDLPLFIKGAINLRGHLLPVVDLVELLGASRPLPPPPLSADEQAPSAFKKNTRFALVSQEGCQYAVIIDGVEHIKGFEQSEVRSSIGADKTRPKYLQGVISSEGEVTQILYINHLLTEQKLAQLSARSQQVPGHNDEAEDMTTKQRPMSSTSTSVAISPR